MKRKRPDPSERQRELRDRHHRNAQLLEAEHPAVEEIRVDLEFTDPSGFRQPLRQPTRLFTSRERAFFEFECPDRECISGGFNLSSTVRDAVNSRLPDATGQVDCQGWLDRERIRKHRCFLRCKFQINITYKRTS
jgi:hypothetical protein